MDGVAMISQCPILPRQTFEYDFIADPPGKRSLAIWLKKKSFIAYMEAYHGYRLVNLLDLAELKKGLCFDQLDRPDFEELTGNFFRLRVR